MIKTDKNKEKLLRKLKELFQLDQPDFTNAKVGDECFSPIHGIGYFTMMKHKWGETTVVYDNGVRGYAVCAKGTTTHPLRYNSFAQFQAYWAEKALEMGGKQ